MAGKNPLLAIGLFVCLFVCLLFCLHWKEVYDKYSGIGGAWFAFFLPPLTNILGSKDTTITHLCNCHIDGTGMSMVPSKWIITPIKVGWIRPVNRL